MEFSHEKGMKMGEEHSGRETSEVNENKIYFKNHKFFHMECHSWWKRKDN